MALGIARDPESGEFLLNNFAKSTGTSTYGDIYGAWWPGSMEKLQSNISEAMTNADALHFNLEGMSQSAFETFQANPVFSEGNITNWELNKIFNSPTLMNKTTFHGTMSP